MENKEGPAISMDEIVEALRDKSPKELLSYAIFNEEEEAKYYAKLAEKAKRASIKALFIKMSEDSKGHRDWLYRLFKKLYPDEEPVKVEAPPVEVAPFYPEFESVEDYLSALKYCMESELFAKKTYELLAKVARDEDTKAFALNLAAMEEDHYNSIRKMYELMLSLEEKEITPEKLEPGGYLFTDELKAKYFLIDLLESGVELSAVIREKPEKFLEMLDGNRVSVVWITRTEVEGSIRPDEIPMLKKRFCRFLGKTSEGRGKGAVFLQNLSYLALELGFKSMMDVVLYLKDCALLYDGYILATAVKEAFSPREWALLTSELKEVS
jgi:rubrerythrin